VEAFPRVEIATEEDKEKATKFVVRSSALGNKHVYGGTVPRAEVQYRRKRAKASRKARRLNRGKGK
jgi:hypothetical protein